MSENDLWMSLLVFASVATISPGGATTLATASGVQFGFSHSIPLLAGIALGLATLVGLVAVGLGSVLVSFPDLQLWLRMVGSAYLLWLAWTIARSNSPKNRTGTSAAPIGFFAGCLLLWLNPKAWSMALASAGAYVQLAENPLILALLMGTVFALVGSLSLTLWCAGGVWLSKLIKTNWQWHILNTGLGILIVISTVPMWL